MPPPMLLPAIARRIAADAGSENHMCWTCGSCDFECPVNTATGGRLRPQRLVRLASLGFFEELIAAPEIWYCLQCNGCRQVCPNLVRPSEVIAYARAAAMQEGVLPKSFYFEHAALQVQRQRLIRQAAAARSGVSGLHARTGQEAPVRLKDIARSEASPCWTCGECSSVCPAAAGRDVFDPRSIFRAVSLGLSRQLKQSPAIWMCLSCGRCTDVCSQEVDGRQIIADLQRAAVSEGYVDAGFPYHWRRQVRVVHRCWVDAVDHLLSAHGNAAHDRAPDCGDMATCIRKDTFGETIPFPRPMPPPESTSPAKLRRHA